jgi:thymidylate synthase (FAD)
MASLSVKSTRYTLKELKEENTFSNGMSAFELMEKYGKNDKEEVYNDIHMKRASKYLVWTDEIAVDYCSIVALENLRLMLVNGISNDKAKYCLPESYKSELTWSINARSLQNFISLRSGKSALWEIQDMARKVYDALPSEHKYLFDNSISN